MHLPEIVGTERCVSEVVKQRINSRPSDRRRRTPDGRACCDDVVARRDDGGWKIEVADDWQRPMWGGSSSRGTGEPCLGDTGELSLRAYGVEQMCQASVELLSITDDTGSGIQQTL